MKRCPECRRDYYDDTLFYCLDDGNALLEGPASMDEPATAILHDATHSSEGLTVVMPGSASFKESATRMMSSQPSISGDAMRSIAVLPFRNISRDESDEYFSDGLTEEIISDLSAVRSLKVISRASSMKLKGTDKDSRTISTELNVRYILDGSVRKAGEQIRISAQLIDGLTDENLWADKYSGTLDDIFEIQESVSRSIVDALKITLSADEERAIEEREIDNPYAYDLYLKARAEFVKGSPEALDRSIELLHKGLEIIGDNELILASLGYAHYHYFRWISKLDKGHLEQAGDYMRRTFAHNSAASHGHVLKGLLAYSSDDMTETLRSLKKAVEIKPTNTEALFWLAINLNYIGAVDEADRYAARLCELDPLQSINVMIRAVSYTYAGKFTEALDWMTRSLAMEPDSPLLLWSAAIIQAWAGNAEKAIEHFDRLTEVAPNWIYSQHGLFQKHGMLGEKELALEHNLPEMAEEAKYDCHFALHMAECFALIGENDTAFAYLTSPVEGGMVNVPFFTEHDWLLQGLKSDARFEPLMKRADLLLNEILTTK